ncbi:gamma-glutamylcyclotransferase family protein [Mucilaginibacter sp. PPCGB 2223]|uniref:gamma-glutamylcyclotransferase family protein n=1 Tax=Mucilaginibacter sp. PPCGB 2223 TaxID=1886027 RepID=UPI0011124C9F|nr:gamma-glutamylcyclotransferase family protein [Mucilaginibacter sp. PPCGB 2223]
MILFAYASNMNVTDFTRSLPSARKLGNAYLPGHAFVFNKTAKDRSSKANVMPVDNPDVPVWGVLLEFNDEDARIFDKGDWHKHMELKPMQCVDVQGNLVTAHVFISLPHAVNEYLLPYDWYKEKLVTLAAMQNLPANYIAALKLMPAKPDPNVKRAERRMKKFRESL